MVLHDPYDDPPGAAPTPAPHAHPPGLELREDSPEPTKELLAGSRIGADEAINDYEGLEDAEVVEIMAEKESKARATILEMVGDLPEANVAPPENVLFVCKLNPVTCDDDLEIIFSRFGKVIQCEVIRDRISNESLQYAFVEFENRESCEKAYFKMDNVLIDDRRIHVDFSQSVSRFRWKGKGRLEYVAGQKQSFKEGGGGGGKVEKEDLKEVIERERKMKKESGRGDRDRGDRDDRGGRDREDRKERVKRERDGSRDRERRDRDYRNRERGNSRDRERRDVDDGRDRNGDRVRGGGRDQDRKDRDDRRHGDRDARDRGDRDRSGDRNREEKSRKTDDYDRKKKRRKNSSSGSASD